jgi:hypothetical protein
VPQLPTTPRQRLWPKLLAGFRFQALKVNRLRSWIHGADLARNLFAERHAGHKVRAASSRM